MKQFILLTLFLPSFLFAQYWGERTTEQSFEQSELYFTSHFLNTFGVYRFKNVAPGLIDDPFLNLYLNPANLPEFSESQTLLYLDFRGDRTEEPVLDYGITPYFGYDSYYMYCIPPDPRWLSTTRAEPEPIVSLGILSYPISEITKNFFVGGSYQLIHKEEPFYTNPYWIYNSRYLYDSFGGRMEGLDNVPIQDRYSGADEMSNEGHLFSGFIGYNLTEKISLGIGLNGVFHARDGKYINSYSDEYGDTNDWEWQNYQGKIRKQDYDHLDINIGGNYWLNEAINVGLKIGQLNGKAKQKYDSDNNYLSKYKTPGISDEWSYYFSDGSTIQNWKHEGNTQYISFNFNRQVNERKKINVYYQYSVADININTSSSITDTSHHTSHWQNSYSSVWYEYLGFSSTHDVRRGSGQRKKYIHQAMMSYYWQLSPKSSLNFGIYVSRNDTKVSISEPAIVSRYSEYEHSDSQGDYYHDLRKLYEDKQLEWRFKSTDWSLQIPVILNFKLSDHWGMMLGVNRILRSWKIEDETIAYYKKRERIEDGTVKNETNFGERFTQPTEKISEDFTDVIAGFDVAVSQEFKIKLLIDPEFVSHFRVAQWWLGFEAKL